MTAQRVPAGRERPLREPNTNTARDHAAVGDTTSNATAAKIT